MRPPLSATWGFRNHRSTRRPPPMHSCKFRTHIMLSRRARSSSIALRSSNSLICEGGLPFIPVSTVFKSAGYMGSFLLIFQKLLTSMSAASCCSPFVRGAVCSFPTGGFRDCISFLDLGGRVTGETKLNIVSFSRWLPVCTCVYKPLYSPTESDRTRLQGDC